MADPARHADSRNWIESITRKIPGFKGYLEKEYRRESDQLARNVLVEHLQKAKSALDNYQRSLVDQGQLDALPLCERQRSKLDQLQSRIKGAMKGYSGFFDFVRVDETLLDQVYQHDLSLADDGASLVTSCDALGTTTEVPAVAVAKIQKQIEELSREFDKRAALLEGTN